MQLYQFDSPDAESPMSSDMYLARRYDDATSAAVLVYIPLSGANDVPPDSMLSDC